MRVFNELASPNSPAVTASTAVGPFASAPAGGTSGAWAPVGACNNTLLTLSAPGFSSPAPIPLPADGAESGLFTLLVVTPAVGPATQFAAYLLADPAPIVPNARNTVDASSLRIVNARGIPVSLFGAATECFNCLKPRIGPAQLAQGAAATVAMSASFALALDVRATDQSTKLMSLTLPFPNEYAQYTLILHGGSLSSALLVDAPGRNGNLPLLWAFLILLALFAAHRVTGLGLAALARAARTRSVAPLERALEAAALARPNARAPVSVAQFCAFDRVIARALAITPAAVAEKAAAGLDEVLLQPSSDSAASEPPRAAAPATGGLGRVRSLDTFRGLILCVMAFSNAGSGGYSYLGHAAWNGLQLADICFPLFIYFSGVSAALSFASERRRGASPRSLAAKAAVRSLKLWFLGLFLVNGVSYFPTMRMFSVLGYFAASTMIVGLIDAFVPVIEREPSWPWIARSPLARSLWRDVGRYALQWAAAACVLIVYFICQYLPNPGCPPGYVGPGGRADGGAYPASCVGGAHRLIDESLVTLAHIYGGPTCRSLYGCGAFDPEGTLGTLGASLIAFLGLQAGRVLVAEREDAEASSRDRFSLGRRLALRWVASGLAFGFVAGCFCSFAKEGGWRPVNKNLWSPSLAFLIAGTGNVGMAALFALVDSLRLWSGAPFRYAGANSLTFYIISELPFRQFPYRWQWTQAGWASHEEILTSNLGQVVFLLSVMRYFHLKGWMLIV